VPARELSYLPVELHSYLPSGWNLGAVERRRFDERRGVWSAPVVDGAEQEWELVVKADDAARLGRLPALRRAMDRLYREALG
jgi:hypothetical protein